MPIRLQKTDLSVTPPVYAMADTDRESIAFDAGSAITTATPVLTRIDTNAVVVGPVESSGVAGNIATVVVSGLTRGVAYELAVTFLNAAGRKWTRTLILDVVA